MGAPEVTVRWLAVFCALLWCGPAFAGVVLVPAPPLVGDGITASTVRFYVDDSARIRIKPESGKAGTAVVGMDGVWALPFTPPAVTVAGTIAFKVTAGGTETTIEVPVVPAFSGAITVSFDPPSLPSTATALVRITPSGSSPITADRRRFTLWASAGTLEPVTPAGNGTWVARYTPPKSLTAPLAVVFTAADAASPDQIFGDAVLPITVKRAVTLDVKPSSSNVLTVGGRAYGPVVAAPNGKVAFDIDLDPREPTGQLRSVAPDTAKEDRTVPLPVAAAAQIAFLPLPANLPAQADLSVSIRLLVVGADGKPKADATVRLSASKGTITPATWDRGMFAAAFTPPSTPGEVTLTAEIDGAKAQARLKLVGSLPSLVLAAQPAEIAVAGTTLSVVARVKDAQGTGLVGRPPTLTVEGATSAGSAKDNSDGSYTFPYKVATSTSAVRVHATPLVDASGMPAARLLAWPSAETIVANGADVVTVTVVATDSYGVPVANVDLKLGSPRGDGSVPPTGKTDARGIARIPFRAGVTPGVASVRIEGAGLVTELALFQSTDGYGPLLPTGGNPAEEALIARWRAAAPTLRVVRMGTAAPIAPLPIVIPTQASPAQGSPASASPPPAGVAGAARPSTPSARAPRPPAPAAPTEWATLRVGGGLINSRGTYTQTSDAGAQLLGQASFETPGAGFFGFAADAVWLPLPLSFGTLGLDVRARAQLEWFNVGESPFINVQRDLIGAARYRRGLGGPFSVEGSLGAHYTTGVLFRYSDAARTRAEILNFPLIGVRLGALASVEAGRVYASLELAETFAPFPIDTHAEALVDIVTGDTPTTLRIGATWDRRSMRYKAEGVGSDVGLASVEQTQFGVQIGAGTTF